MQIRIIQSSCCQTAQIVLKLFIIYVASFAPNTQEAYIMNTSDLLTVHVEQKDYTLTQLKEDVDSNDIITNPDYQRNYI